MLCGDSFENSFVLRTPLIYIWEDPICWEITSLYLTCSSILAAWRKWGLQGCEVKVHTVLSSAKSYLLYPRMSLNNPTHIELPQQGSWECLDRDLSQRYYELLVLHTFLVQRRPADIFIGVRLYADVIVLSVFGKTFKIAGLHLKMTSVSVTANKSPT